MADKGLPQRRRRTGPQGADCRSYIPEPDRGQRNWEGKEAEQKQRVRQPAADSWDAQQATATEAHRTDRKQHGPHVRNRRNETCASERKKQHPETTAGSCWRLQPGTSPALFPTDSFLLPNQLSLKFQPVCAVHQSIQDAASHGGVADLRVPLGDRQLAGHQCGPSQVA